MLLAALTREYLLLIVDRSLDLLFEERKRRIKTYFLAPLALFFTNEDV